MLKANDDQHDAKVGQLNANIIYLDARIVSLETQIKYRDDLLTDLPESRRAQRAENATLKLMNATLENEISVVKSAHKTADIARLELVGQYNVLCTERDDALAKVALIRRCRRRILTLSRLNCCVASFLSFKIGWPGIAAIPPLRWLSRPTSTILRRPP